MPAVADLFDTVGRQLSGPLGAFFRETAAEMNAVSGRSPQTAMRMAADLCPMDREESGLLLELGGCLGRYDLSGQARALELYKRQADRLIQEAEAQLKHRASAAVTASVCAGLALIVILL